MAGLYRTGAVSDRRFMAGGMVAGLALAGTSVGMAVAFWTADYASNDEAKIALAALVVPLSFSIVVISSALRHSANVRHGQYLPALAALFIVVVAVSSGIWSAATAEHMVNVDFIGTVSPPDVTLSERVNAFSSLTVFPFALAVLVLASGQHARYRPAGQVLVALGMLLAIGFAAWSASDHPSVPVQNFSDWRGNLPISSSFWTFTGILMTYIAVYSLALARTRRPIELAQGQ